MLLTVERLIERALAEHPTGAHLNIGCGWDRREGWCNVDVRPLSTVDAVCRVGPGGLPFADGSFQVVLCRDVLEHCEAVDALREVHRVLAPGGAAVISTVHFTSRNLYVDPTHQRGFSVRTLDHFVDGATDRGYYFDYSFASVESTIQFSALLGKGRYLVWDRVVEPFVNRTAAGQDLYEMTFAARLFPAANVLAVLRR